MQKIVYIHPNIDHNAIGYYVDYVTENNGRLEAKTKDLDTLEQAEKFKKELTTQLAQEGSVRQ